MGGPMGLLFLQDLPPDWKNKYIEQFITLNAPWGGTVQAIEAVTVGYDLGEYVLPNYAMKSVQKSCSSLAWLMPSQHFWKQHELLVKTSVKNYSLSNIDELFL